MGLSVLIVDDHDDFRTFARLLLESGGFTVIGEAADAASALTEAQRLQPDVALVDVGLPDRDGIDLAGDLAGQGVPATVLVSSRDAAAYGPRLRVSRALGFIAKSDLSTARLRAVLDTAP
jgi:DNA-binding NarL/FixJ family response regulator